MKTLHFKSVLDFWFEELGPKDWFGGGKDLDIRIKSQFLEHHRVAAQGELFSWRETAEGRLAEILILDQFSRNIFRGEAQSFASDPLALALAQECVRLELDQQLATAQRTFVYMPYMHSESKMIHEQAVQLFRAPGMENNLEYEYLHKKIIDRFGRYPHRNKILGRPSTPEEIEFLKQPNSSF